MYLKELRIEGFKSFGKSATLTFPTRITGIVGPNGSGKSNVAEAFRFVLGEQSMKSMRGKRGEDLIFNGGSGAGRANRAKVSIVFDNSDTVLNSAFGEVSVSRTVYRNGNNEYAINDTQVRHRDIIELLAKANIGSTGHHIISQGEADRILHVSSEERKEILEDGLGLKLLQYRRAEAEKKLQRARANMAETELMLREVTPHLRHLKRQVDRYEKAKHAREDLVRFYAEYLAYETGYVAEKKCDLQGTSDTLTEKLTALEKEVAREKKNTMKEHVSEKYSAREHELLAKTSAVQGMKDVASREIGRLEGEREVVADLARQNDEVFIGREKIAQLYDDIRDRYSKDTEGGYAALVAYILEQLKHILNRGNTTHRDAEKHFADSEQKQNRVRERLAQLKKQEEELVCALGALRQEKERVLTSAHQSEKNVVFLITKKNTIEREIFETCHALAILQEDEENIKRELTEGAVLIGTAIHTYKEVIVPREKRNEDREKQKERRRALERKKVELEAMDAGGGEEVYKEYKDVSERVDFLNREKKDLLHSIQDCESGIETIEKEVDTRFKAGIQAISKEFERFFKILFGGGKAEIFIEKNTVIKEDEEDVRIGVAVRASLPRKKITAMEQLSGGERALTSIALLFAISQVMPPLFLILDETDAALDEANSQRYGDMIEVLAKKSQLILITHNRETMHRAGALYGVTMNTVGVSALLSVQFDEAVQTTK